MVVLKMIDWARRSFKKETLFSIFFVLFDKLTQSGHCYYLIHCIDRIIIHQQAKLHNTKEHFFI